MEVRGEAHTPRVVNATYRDAGAFAASFAETADCEGAQLDAGRLNIETSTLALEDLALTNMRANAGFTLQATFHEGWTSFVLPTPAPGSGCKWCGSRVLPDALGVFRPSREHDVRFSGNWSDLQFMVSDSTIQSRGLAPEELIELTRQPEQGQLPLTAPHTQRLTQRLEKMIARTAQSGQSAQVPISNQRLREVLLDELSLAVELGLENRRAVAPLKVDRRHALVRRACRHVADQDGAITAETLAADLGTELWVLQRAFRRSLGVSPYQYLLRQRLNTARRQLLARSNELSVTEVAAEHGFTSASAFASHYRRFFGELPSATRARTRPAAS